MDRAPLFQLESVTLDRPGPGGSTRQILDRVSLTLPAEGITCLTGPSGSGKSTLLRLLNRLEEPTSGLIRYRGEPLSTYPPGVLRRRVGLVLQSPVMLPGTVRTNLEAGLRLRGESLVDPASWLQRLDLPGHLLDRPAGELSGGEQQRIALARTLVTRPEALLLDEVTAALDEASAAVVEALIRTAGVPVVWISHDPAQVRRVADRTYRIEGGRLQEVISA